MYSCASADGDGLACANSPCATRFLRPLIDEYVQPGVVITFGTSIPQFFRKHLLGIRPKVLHLPFRGYRLVSLDSSASNARERSWNGRQCREPRSCAQAPWWP